MWLLRTLEQWLSVICGICVAGLMLFGTMEIAGRNLFNHPFPGHYEGMSALLIIVVFLGWSYTQAKDIHVDIDMLTRYFGDNLQMWLSLFRCVLAISVMIFIDYCVLLNTILAWEYWDVTMGVVHFPLAPVKATITLGCVLLTIRYIVDFAGVIKTARKGALSWTR
ncbi:MAG: TRAP transporter small permease [Dehalococcoidales bacterium]|nr:TRAP transporter small permease [Dehalococcoidales bacterium]